MTRRQTSIYALSVPSHVPVDQLLDAMMGTAHEMGIQVTGSWSRFQGKVAVVLFRTTDDATAKSIAESLGGNTIGSRLNTGLGVHRRTVAES